MPTATLPTKPVDNWEQVRDEWIAAVDQLLRQVEVWCQQQGWAVRQETKPIEESRLGSYQVPQLLFQINAHRLLFSPVARFVPGALGLVELCVLPSYDALMIPRTENGWFCHADLAGDTRQPLNEATFVESVRRLIGQP